MDFKRNINTIFEIRIHSSNLWYGCLIVFLVFVVEGCEPVGLIRHPSDQKAEIQALNEAVAAFERSDFTKAEKLLQNIISEYPGSTILIQSQWMLARTYERQGNWHRALNQYESFALNYPHSLHTKEARLRKDLLRELIIEKDNNKKYPILKGIEVVDLGHSGDLIKKVRRQGFNTFLFDSSRSDPSLSAQFVLDIHRADFYVMDIVRIDVTDLFNNSFKTRLKQRMIDIAVLGMDGVLFEGSVRNSSLWYRDEVIREFRSNSKQNFSKKEISNNPTLYWRWTGWRGRQVVKHLRDSVNPIQKIYRGFYWGMIFPSEVITLPHKALSKIGLDLLEAKNSGMDYFGIRESDSISNRILMSKASDLIGQDARVASVIASPFAAPRLKSLQTSKYSVLILK